MTVSSTARYGGSAWGRGPWGGRTPGAPTPPVPPDALDAFSSDPGWDAGRVAPANVTPADGSYVFCLGHDAPGFFGHVQPGEYDEIAQQELLPADCMLTFQARTRGPVAALASGYTWEAQVLVDGAIVSTREIDPGFEIDWDWTIDLTGLVDTTSHTIAFRLAFTGPSLPGPPGLPVLDTEIPAFYIDDLSFFGGVTPASHPAIVNEVPTSNQGISAGTAPARSTAIDFDVFGLGANIDPSTVTVTVNGTPAVTAGVAQAGFTATIGSAAEIVHVHIQPAAEFNSAQTVTVIASAQRVSAGTSTSRTWSFKVADTTAPVMISARALATKQIRVTWSKTVETNNPGGANDSLNPNLYLLEAVQPDALTPYVNPTVTGATIVQQSNPTIIDLFTDIELTEDIPYDLTEIDVQDLFGNKTINVVGFDSFILPEPVGRAIDLYREMPLMNRQEDLTRDLLKFLRCIQEPTKLLFYDVDTWTEIFDVDVAADPFLDAMLEDLGNPFPFVLTTLQKRKLIRILVAIYKQKGTGDGIINAIHFFLGITVTIETFVANTMRLGISKLGVDWILGPGNSFALYAFNVVSPSALTADQIQQISFIANYMKPAHTHLVKVKVPVTPPPYLPVELGISKLGVDWILHEGVPGTVSVDSVSPSSTPGLGGALMTIHGSGFFDPAFAVFVDTSQVNFEIIDDETIEFIAPPHAGGIVSVTVVGDGGQDKLNAAFTYTAPTVTGVDKSQVSVAGGDYIVITGTNFLAGGGASYVQFGGVDAASYTVDSSTQITAITPEMPFTGVPVAVSAGGGSLPSAVEFIMRIDKVYPSIGDRTLPTRVTILGEGFTGADLISGGSVTVGGTAATAVFVRNDGEISFLTPAGSTGAKDIVITTTNGSVTLSGGFEYWDPALLPNLLELHDPSPTKSTIAFGSGSLVASISDLSGNGKTASQATGANQPTYIGQDPAYGYNSVLQWPGSNTNISLSSSCSLPSVFTFFCFGQDDGAGTDLFYCTNGAGNPEPYLASSLGQLIAHDGSPYSAKSYILNKPTLMVDVRNGSACKLFAGNMNKPIATGTLSGTAGGTTLTIGNNDFGGGNSLSNAKWAVYGFVSGAMADSDRKKLARYCAGRFNQGDPSIQFNFVPSGNSLTQGSSAHNPDLDDWVDMVISALPRGWKGTKDGNSGAQTSALMDGHTSLPFQNNAQRSFTFTDEITNDIGTGGADGTVAAANQNTWISNLQKYIDFVGFGTCMNRSSGGWGPTQEGYRLAANATLTTGATAIPGLPYWYQRPDGALIFDKANIPQFLDSTDLRYFAGDGVHLNAVGHAIWARYFLPIIPWIQAQP